MTGSNLPKSMLQEREDRAWIDGYEAAVAMVDLAVRTTNGPTRRACEALVKTLEETRDHAAELGERQRRERDDRAVAALRLASSTSRNLEDDDAA